MKKKIWQKLVSRETRGTIDAHNGRSRGKIESRGEGEQEQVEEDGTSKTQGQVRECSVDEHLMMLSGFGGASSRKHTLPGIATGYALL